MSILSEQTHVSDGLDNGLLSRLIDAVRLGGQGVAGDGVGSGTAAAADVAVFADAAVALELVGVLQLAERRVVLVDVHDRVVRKLPAAQRQEAGGVDFALVVDEHHASAVGDAQRGAVAAPGGTRLLAAGARQGIAAVLAARTGGSAAPRSS